MEKLLICALGTHDLQIKEQYHDFFLKYFKKEELSGRNISKDLRKFTEKIWFSQKEYKQMFNILDKDFTDFFPIISAYLSKIRLTKNDNLKIIMFITDQSTPHEQDTINLFHILNKILKKRGNIQADNIIIKDDPSNYALMFRNLQEKFSKELIEKITQHEYAEKFLGITGGTPAINMAFLINIYQLGNDFSLLYTPKTYDTSIAKILDLSGEMQFTFFRNYIEQVKHNSNIIDYNLIAVLYNKVGEDKKELVAGFLNNFFNMRFRHATEIIEKFYSYGIDQNQIGFDSDLLCAITNDYNKLENTIFILREFIENDLKTGNIEQFVVRAISLIEFYVIYALKQITGVEPGNYKDYQKKQILKAEKYISEFYEHEQEEKNYKEFLKKFGFNYSPNWNLKFSNFTNFIIDLLALSIKYPEKLEFDEIFRNLEKLYSLKKIRNDISHSIFDFDEEKEIIQNKYSSYLESIDKLQDLIVGNNHPSYIKNLQGFIIKGITYDN